VLRATIHSMPLLSTALRVAVALAFGVAAVSNGMLAVEFEHSHADEHHDHGHHHYHHHGDGSDTDHGSDPPAPDPCGDEDRDSKEDTDRGTHRHTVLIEAGQMIAPVIERLLPAAAPTARTVRTGHHRCPTGPSFDLLKPPQLL